MRVLGALHPHQHFLCLFFKISTLVGLYGVITHCGFSLHNNLYVEHLFMYWFSPVFSMVACSDFWLIFKNWVIEL